MSEAEYQRVSGWKATVPWGCEGRAGGGVRWVSQVEQVLASTPVRGLDFPIPANTLFGAAPGGETAILQAARSSRGLAAER